MTGKLFERAEITVMGTWVTGNSWVHAVMWRQLCLPVSQSTALQPGHRSQAI